MIFFLHLVYIITEIQFTYNKIHHLKVYNSALAGVS